MTRLLVRTVVSAVIVATAAAAALIPVAASAGRTVLSRIGRPTGFETVANGAAFEQRFLDSLNNRR